MKINIIFVFFSIMIGTILIPITTLLYYVFLDKKTKINIINKGGRILKNNAYYVALGYNYGMIHTESICTIPNNIFDPNKHVTIIINSGDITLKDLSRQIKGTHIISQTTPRFVIFDTRDT